MAQLVGLVALGNCGDLIVVPFYHRGGLLGADHMHDNAGVQRVLQRQYTALPGQGELDLHASCTPCWSQVIGGRARIWRVMA